MPSTIDEVHKDVREVRAGVEALRADLAQYQVSTEGRLSRVEVRSGLLAVFVGAFAGWVASLTGR